MDNISYKQFILKLTHFQTSKKKVNLDILSNKNNLCIFVIEDMKNNPKLFWKDKILGCSTEKDDGRIITASAQGLVDNTVTKIGIDMFDDITVRDLILTDWNMVYINNKMSEPDFSRFWGWKI